MKVYVVERHFRDHLVIPFAVTLLELFENRIMHEALRRMGEFD